MPFKRRHLLLLQPRPSSCIDNNRRLRSGATSATPAKRCLGQPSKRLSESRVPRCRRLQQQRRGVWMLLRQGGRRAPSSSSSAGC